MLNMERCGFKPEDTFTAEQIEIMRKMKPRGQSTAHQKSKFGALLDRADHAILQGKPGTSFDI